MTGTQQPVLALENASVSVRGGSGRTHDLISDVNLALCRDEIVGLVGESGCGKSTTARALLGLIPLSSGILQLHGEPVHKGLGRLRSSVQAIFQDPTASFNPKRTLLDSVAEPLRVRGMRSRTERRERALAELDRVGITSHIARRRPTEVSGGQCQRAAIARAIITRPEVLICDEPVSALDVSIQAQILSLLAELRRELGISMLFISHDLSVVATLCDRTTVMYAGRIVEQGPTLTVANKPAHPYTAILHDSVPDSVEESETAAASGLSAEADDFDGREQPGCRYEPACPLASAQCRDRFPDRAAVGPQHTVACVHPLRPLQSTPTVDGPDPIDATHSGPTPIHHDKRSPR